MTDKNRKAKRKKEKSDDPYWDAVLEQWDNIVNWYLMFADKKPVMLYDIQEQKVYAYPYLEFKAEMSQKSQDALAEQYQRAVRNNEVVVFVRDNAKRKLVLYTLALGFPEKSGVTKG